MSSIDHLTAAEAGGLLGVRIPTLYAYVSRGLIRSEPAGGEKRQRRYNREDVQRLRLRQEERHNPARVAQHALFWGDPVMESGLTLIADGKLYYRGRDVISIAKTATLEEVAALLWTGQISDVLFQRPSNDTTPVRANSRGWARVSGTIENFQVVLAEAAVQDPAAFDLRAPSVIQTGVRILRLLTTTVAQSTNPASAGIADSLQQSWAPGKPEARQLLNAALILCADHELNISSFTARCIASAGSTPYAAVIGGLAALEGNKHGGHTRRVEALLNEIGSPARVGRVLSQRLTRGEVIPGFGHPLYPNGDPRAELLLQMTAAVLPRSSRVKLAGEVADQALHLIGEQPTIDFALVILAQSLHLPEDSALALFAIGRTVGWIGHALEQYRQDRLIRPRARYTGPAPQDLE